MSEELIKNSQGQYNTLSKKTAEGRREGTFPELLEHGRRIERHTSWDDPAALIRWAQRVYRVDRTKGQPHTIVLAIEKNALKGLLVDWFGDLGVPVLPLGGYGSETLERKIRDHVFGQERPAVLIYAGDFDASGVHIWETFSENTSECWTETVRLGLTETQITDLALPVLQGKDGDPRAPEFIAAEREFHERAWRSGAVRSGWPVQVELDAVEPTMLRDWYQEQIDRWWDQDAYAEQMQRERADDRMLSALADFMPEAPRTLVELGYLDEVEDEDE